jgi:hypothetical protein
VIARGHISLPHICKTSTTPSSIGSSTRRITTYSCSLSRSKESGKQKNQDHRRSEEMSDFVDYFSRGINRALNVLRVHLKHEFTLELNLFINVETYVKRGIEFSKK